MSDERSQVDAFGAPRCRSWADYWRGALATYRGGHHDQQSLAAFQHGMKTVFTLLENEFPPADVCKAAPKLLSAIADRDPSALAELEAAADKAINLMTLAAIELSNDRDSEPLFEDVRNHYRALRTALAKFRRESTT